MTTFESPATIDISAVRETLETRKARLVQVAAELKQEFFGIDGIIDKVIESVQTWYLLPQIITRCQIVCLFGLTGTGKTALIRMLANKLGFDSRYVEIQMDGYSNGSTTQPTSICQILQSSSIEEGQPGIISLDEFQRFRTIDEKGMEVKLERYQDVWMLLSDGKFSSDYSFLAKIEQQLAEDEYWDDQRRADKAEEEEKKEEPKLKRGKKGKKVVKEKDKYKRKYVLYPYEAKVLKKLLRLKQSLMEIMTWERDRVRAVVREHVEANKNSAIDYTKCLVFVAGNIDEAFKMSGDVEDCDTSADTFYEHTKKIGPIEIKKALKERFYPEQIARLGNNHIVYPSLNRDAYERIIRRACQTYVEEARKVCGVTFSIRESVYQEIYDNSVYPTQGTRPVFTSIHKMFGSPLSDAILWALEHGYVNVTVDLDIAASSLEFVGAPGGVAPSKRVKIDFDIRARRATRSEDFTTLVAAHEAGHAVAYAVLFNVAPIEVAVNVASYTGGYNMFKDMTLHKAGVLDRMTVGMAGIAAEQLLFGEAMRSTGCSADVENVTNLAGNYTRFWSMDDTFPARILEPGDGAAADNRMVESSGPIAQLVSQQKKRAFKLMRKHRELLVDLSRHLVKVKKMDAAAFLAFVGDRVPNLRVSPVNVDVCEGYARLLAKA